MKIKLTKLAGLKKIKDLTEIELQVWLDHYILYSKKEWLLLLEEKLRRIEQEIAVI